MLGPFEEEEEGTGVASDVVKVQGEDPDTPDYLRRDRVRLARGVGDLGSWVRLPWLAHDEAPGPYITIPQYRFNKTKQPHSKVRPHEVLPITAYGYFSYTKAKAIVQKHEGKSWSVVRGAGLCRFSGLVYDLLQRQLF